jgi:hypothetical protein
MNDFEYPSAKLLYMVNEMFKLQMIEAAEKTKLKGSSNFIFARNDPQRTKGTIRSHREIS